MRTFLMCSTIALAVACAQGQDPGMMAAQQAQMAASQQAFLWNMQIASQNAWNMMNAGQTSSLFDYGWGRWWWPTENTDHQRPDLAPPHFSIGSGTYSSPVTLTINSNNSGAEIYYSTDGWTPTQYSIRYAGPIQLDSSVTLQAIAVSPWGARSQVREAVYTLNVKPGMQSPAFPSATPGVISSAAAAAVSSGRRLLARDTPVQLVFATAVSSKTAKVGDRIFLTLADNLESDGVVVAREGTRAVAVITEVDKARRLGAPGEVSFKLESLRAKGINIKLRGGAARLGLEQREKADTAGAFGLFIRGKDARIDPGAKFTAQVASDTLLPAN
jgi:hypothetical protein